MIEIQYVYATDCIKDEQHESSLLSCFGKSEVPRHWFMWSNNKVERFTSQVFKPLWLFMFDTKGYLVYLAGM